MNKKKIQQTSTELYRVLKKELQTILPDFDPEAIHQFRVAYKKLRAFFRIISYQGLRQVKPAGRLKKLYRLAGEIRDRQLQQQRIRLITNDVLLKPTAWLGYLEHEIGKLEQAFIAAIKHRPVKASEAKTNSLLPGRFTNMDLAAFVKGKLAAVHTIIESGDFCDENIHQVRKYLKDLFYNQKIIPVGEKDVLWFPLRKKEHEHEVQKLLTELGNFQDACVSTILLKFYLAGKLNKADRDAAMQVRRCWMREKRTLKNSVKQQLMNFET